MLKRKAEGGGDEGPSKKNQGIASEGKVNPIPRHLPLQSITLNFYQSTWEEIAPGNLYYLPLSQNPKYMFDVMMERQFNKFRNLWGTMEIHHPKVRISNLIMLQDDLRVQNNTPTDATAFTQVVYMIKYCPKGLKNYFGLTDVESQDTLKSKRLSYKLEPVKSDTNPSQLVTLQNFQDFERLGVTPAKANHWGGFEPGSAIKFTGDNYQLTNAYIPPNVDSVLNAYSGNLQVQEKDYLVTGETLLMARNLDSKSYYKYGDTIEIPITTNLDGIQLHNTRANDFLEEQIIDVQTPDKTTKLSYEGEFCWPGRNRAVLTRHNYFDRNTDPIIHGKEYKPLSHCFFCMPPIRKPNGSLLGQRCSFTMEQSMAVTFHMNQATFCDTEGEDGEQMSQDSSVIIRRNFYPVPDKTLLKASVLCPNGISECDPASVKPCITDDFKGLIDFFNNSQPELKSKIVASCKLSHQDAKPIGSINILDIMKSEDGAYVNWEDMDEASYSVFKTQWNAALASGSALGIYWPTNITDPKQMYPYRSGNNYVFMALTHDPEDYVVQTPVTNPAPNYMQINVKDLINTLVIDQVANLCPTPKKQFPAPQRAVANKVCTTFFV